MLLPVEKALEREKAGEDLEAEVESLRALAVEEAHILSAIFSVCVCVCVLLQPKKAIDCVFFNCKKARKEEGVHYNTGISCYYL